MIFNIHDFTQFMKPENKAFYNRFFGGEEELENQGFLQFIDLREEGKADHDVLLRKQHFDKIAETITARKFPTAKKERKTAILEKQEMML